MPEIIKQPENYTPLSKEQKNNNIRHHLMMMLEAMQYKGRMEGLSNDSLREIVEQEKRRFLRQAQKEMEFKNMYGRLK